MAALSRHLRFSVRGLLLTTALFAMGLYWAILPSVNAKRFAEYLEKGQYKAADALVADSMFRSFEALANQYDSVKATVTVVPLEQNSYWHDRRSVTVVLTLGTAESSREYTFPLIAKRDGMHSPSANEVYMRSLSTTVDQ